MLMKLVDMMMQCPTCDSKVYRRRGKKILTCRKCKFRSSVMKCDSCKALFSFPVGLVSIPCVNCRKCDLISSLIELEKPLSPSMVTCAQLPQFGLLVNKDVNVPDTFVKELESKRPAGSLIHLISQYYLCVARHSFLLTNQRFSTNATGGDRQVS